MYVNGNTLKECFYLRENHMDTAIRRHVVTLGDFFAYDFRVYASVPTQELPLFAFYKDDGADFDLDGTAIGGVRIPKWQPPDFENHCVRIVVSELDNRLMPAKGESVLAAFPATDLRSQMRGLLGEETYGECRRYALAVFEKLRAEPHVLFCYPSTSGLGIRVAFLSQNRIADASQYKEICAAQTAEIVAAHDTEGLFMTDPNTETGRNYWWLPTEKVFVNPCCSPVR